MSEQEELVRQMLNDMNDMHKDMSGMNNRLDSFQHEIQRWKSLLTRDFIAVVMGAILLVIFAVFLMVSMYKGIQTTEVIANGFFVILGFFFSQTAQGMSSKNDGANEMLQKMKSRMDKAAGVTMMDPENEVSKQIQKIMEDEII